MNRRAFLAKSACALSGIAAPSIVRASAFGANAPSNRINVGFIGTGRQAFGANLPQMMAVPGVQVVTVCDVDSWRLGEAQNFVNAFYTRRDGLASYNGCAKSSDFREVIADSNIDALMVSTPDHWHVPIGIMAAKAKKHFAMEKPISLSVEQGRMLSDAVKLSGVTVRNDSEFRSLRVQNHAVELIRNGHLGKLERIEIVFPSDPTPVGVQPDMPVPPELNYDMWLGPTAMVPYTQKRVHTPKSYDRPGWMRHRYYCDGMITNWGAHLNDVAQWGNNTDRTGPIEVEAQGTYPPADSFWNVLLKFEAAYRFANGVRMFYKTDEKVYVRFEGSEGWIFAEYQKPLQAEPAAVLGSKIGDNEIHFPFKSDKQDFIDAVKTRGDTLEGAEVGHRTTSLCHLANIAIQVGKKLEWDPAKERFANSPEANAFVDKWIQASRRS